MVLGKIGGWTMPIQLSLAQVAVLFCGYLLLFTTRALWAHLGPLNVVVLVGGPWLAAWTVRRARVEGRGVLRWLAGATTAATTPRGGECLGRPLRPVRVSRGCGRCFVAGAPGDEA
jgi:hypothetical protein